MAHGGSVKVVLAAMIGNGLIAITKFAAAFYTGSSAMLSEAIHLLVDTGNQSLLLLAMSLDYRNDLNAGAVEQSITRLEDAIRKARPDITRVFIEVQDGPASEARGELPPARA
jgi:divalent metal cation (Fe/Co/Zn/Cd) transporter